MFENFLWLLLAHYVLDYPLQGEFLAVTKGKYWYSLLAHSVIYGLGMGLVFKLIGYHDYAFIGPITAATHVVIDFQKATARDKDKALTSYLYIDQAMHIAINVFFLLTMN